MISRHSPDGRICVHTHTPGEREQAAIERGRQMYLAGEPEPKANSTEMLGGGTWRDTDN